MSKLEGGNNWNSRPNKIYYNSFKTIPVIRFVCNHCGYSEEWVDTQHLEKLKSKFGLPERGGSEFV